jgi:hypothetical protein
MCRVIPSHPQSPLAKNALYSRNRDCTHIIDRVSGSSTITEGAKVDIRLVGQINPKPVPNISAGQGSIRDATTKATTANYAFAIASAFY